MEELGAKKTPLDLPPPAYVSNMTLSRKTWAWASAVLLLLAVIVVGATLIGVYMTQKHTEAVVEMAFHSASGEKVQQTVIVDDKENMAASYIKINNTSTTILYDYKRGLVTFRTLGEKECYVMKMKDLNVPTMKDVLNNIKDSPEQNSAITEISYSFLPGEEKADRTQLGVHINLLCSDLPIYWGLKDKPQQSRGWWKKIWKKAKDFGKKLLQNTSFQVGVSFGLG